MNKNPLIGLKEIGQSVWLDNLSRKLIHSGELKRLIDRRRVERDYLQSNHFPEGHFREHGL